MKKILVINNGHSINQHTVDFAIHVAVEENATLYGLFVQSPNNEGENSNIFEQEKIDSFKNMCNSRTVAYKIYVINSNFLDNLIDHSAFADLMICDADNAPSQYSIKALVAGAYCPALLVNKDYKQTDQIIFTYDDNMSSSIHAVKIFTYLFRSLRHLPVHFVSVVPKNVIGIQYEDLIREWLSLHFPSAEMLIIKGDPKEELTSFINAYSNPLVIMGAFGRSSLSRFFKESLASFILEKTNAPIFIAHD